MKNRRLVIGAFLLAAVLCLSVGFAALTDTLTVEGSVSFNKTNANKDFNADVYFVADSEDTTVKEGSIVDDTKTTAEGVGKVSGVTFTVEDVDTDNLGDKLKIAVDSTVFTAAGQKLVVKAKVHNDSTDQVKVALVSTTNNTESTVSFESAETTISAKSDEYVEITITLLSTDISTGATFTFDLTATTVN